MNLRLKITANSGRKNKLQMAKSEKDKTISE